MIFSFFLPKSKKAIQNIYLLHINAPVDAFDRSYLFEKSLLSFFEKLGYGEIVGGGTQLNEALLPESCDIEIAIPSQYSFDDICSLLLPFLKQTFYLPKGSFFECLALNVQLQLCNCEGLTFLFDPELNPAAQ